MRWVGREEEKLVRVWGILVLVFPLTGLCVDP